MLRAKIKREGREERNILDEPSGSSNDIDGRRVELYYTNLKVLLYFCRDSV